MDWLFYIVSIVGGLCLITFREYFSRQSAEGQARLGLDREIMLATARVYMVIIGVGMTAFGLMFLVLRLVGWLRPA
jgi:hypothetical protein